MFRFVSNNIHIQTLKGKSGMWLALSHWRYLELSFTKHTNDIGSHVELGFDVKVKLMEKKKEEKYFMFALFNLQDVSRMRQTD